MNTKNNQRFRDMDKKLKATMLELLETTDFEKITVKSICETAHVNRSTFYAHYSDVYEIMEQMEEHLNEELLESYSGSPQEGYEPMWNQIIKPKCIAAGITSESEMLYYFVYFQAGFTMVLRRWVDTGCQESEEAVARIIENCIPAIWNTIMGVPR